VEAVQEFHSKMASLELAAKAFKAEIASIADGLQVVESQFERDLGTLSALTLLSGQQESLRALESSILLRLMSLTPLYGKIRDGLQDINKFSQTELDKLNS
jgi:hypothetical protein